MSGKDLGSAVFAERHLPSVPSSLETAMLAQRQQDAQNLMHALTMALRILEKPEGFPDDVRVLAARTVRKALRDFTGEA